MYKEMHKVYIQTNTNGIVTAINSDAFLPDTAGWVQIDEGDGDNPPRPRTLPTQTDTRRARAYTSTNWWTV